MATETDDIRADVIASMAEISGEPVVEAEPIAAPDDPANPPIDETSTQKADRERDEGGRFKAKNGEERPTLKLKDPKEPVGEKVYEEAKTPDGKPVLKTGNDGKITPVLAAPGDWLGDAKIRWGRLDPSIQREILQREEVRSAAVAEIAPLKELIDVNRDFIINQAGSIVEGHRQLYQFARMAETVDGSIQLAQHILRARGLDPRAVFGSGQPQAAPAQNQQQDNRALLASLVQQELQPLRAQFVQQQEHQTRSAIEAFRADPKNPYFNDVMESMTDLIWSARQKGQEMSLETAYDKAVRLDDAIFARVQQDAAETKAAESKRKADAARRATGASLRGSPLPGAVPGATGSGATARDDVLAAFQELAG